MYPTPSSLNVEYVKHTPRAKDVADLVRCILANPSTSYEDRRVAIHYILENKGRFTPLPTDTDDPILNEENSKRNGNNVDRNFFDWLQRIDGGCA